MTTAKQPIPMYLTCPKCNARHIDEGEFATKHHHTHSCQSCGLTWRPAVEPTVGVAFLPGFKNAEESAEARNAKLTELLETLVYWAERGSIDQSWWDEAKSLLGGRP